MKDKEGYLTVYVALSLTVILSLFFAVLEGVRYHTACLEAELITDTGLNSILAEYHRELLEQYNLFFLDSSYGNLGGNLDGVKEHLAYFASKNCSMEGIALGDVLYRDFLKLSLGTVEIPRVALATDAKGGFFRKRAVEAVKDDVGIGYLNLLAGWLETVEENQLGQRDLEGEKKQLDQEISSYDGSQKMVDEEWITLEVENPTAPLEQQTEGGILHLVVEDVTKLSAIGADTNGLVSNRRKQGKMNQGNWEEDVKEDPLDRFFFTEYIMRYCSCYGNPLGKGLLQYQIEYMICGNNNDIDNLKGTVYRLSALREGANALYLFQDEGKCAQAEAAAWAAASAMLLPEIEPLLKAAILLGWAYAESLYDVKCLLAGKKVPLFKTLETWHSDLSSVLEGLLEGLLQKEAGTKEESPPAQEEGEGLGYEDYLRLLLLLTQKETLTFRLMDVVEMDIRQTGGNQSFRMDACIDRLMARLQWNSGFGYSTLVERRISYH